jgi:hypothetical protein
LDQEHGNGGTRVNEFDDYVRKVMAFSVAVAAVGALTIFFTTYDTRPDLFAGFLLGCTFSMLRWRLIIWELRKFAGRRSGAGPWLRGFFIRYALTGAVIAVAAASPEFSIVTAIIGIFLVNAVIIGEQVIAVLRTRMRGRESWE